MVKEGVSEKPVEMQLQFKFLNNANMLDMNYLRKGKCVEEAIIKRMRKALCNKLTKTKKKQSCLFSTTLFKKLQKNMEHKIKISSNMHNVTQDYKGNNIPIRQKYHWCNPSKPQTKYNTF